MSAKCVPMIHVPDVGATVEWYRGIGFDVAVTYGDGAGKLSFAIVSFGTSDVMFSSGGRPGGAERREVDLYVYTEDVDAIHERLKDRVDVVKGPHDMFYGMREVIIRDLNRFWITFAEKSAGDMLMTGVREGNEATVRRALVRPGMSPKWLGAALADASHPAIVALLEQAGAVRPPSIDQSTLGGYAGTYRSAEGLAVLIGLHDGRLLAAPDDAPPVWLLPIDETTFKPIDLADASVAFRVESGRAVGLTFRQGPLQMDFRRVQPGQPQR